MTETSGQDADLNYDNRTNIGSAQQEQLNGNAIEEHGLPLRVRRTIPLSSSEEELRPLNTTNSGLLRRRRSGLLHNRQRHRRRQPDFYDEISPIGSNTEDESNINNNSNMAIRNSSVTPPRPQDCLDWTKPRLMVHTVNILSIIKRYMPTAMDDFVDYQYLSRKPEYFCFADISLKPLDLLEPEEFDCRTKLIVLVKDKTLYTHWGSTWTHILLEELALKKINPMCFTLKSQMSVKCIQDMLEDLPDYILKDLDLIDDNIKIERFVVMSTLAKLLLHWSVPLIVIDTAPSRVIDYKSIMNFAQRAKIKVINFATKEKIPLNPNARMVQKAKRACRQKATEIKKTIDDLYAKDFRSKLEEGYFSMLSVRCVRNPEEICDQVCEPFSGGHESMFVDPEILKHEAVDNTPLAVCTPEACSDVNEWLDWEQPYYDKKEIIRETKRKEAEALDAENRTYRRGTKITLSNSSFTDGSADDEDQWQSYSSGSEDSDNYNGTYIVDSDIVESTKSTSKSRPTYRGKTAEDIKERRRRRLQILYDNGVPKLISVFGRKPRMEAESPRYRSVASCFAGDRSEDENRNIIRNSIPVETEYQKNTFESILGKSRVATKFAVEEFLPPTHNYSMTDPLTSDELKQFKRLMTEFNTSMKLKRLCKYYKKMKEDYKFIVKGVDPKIDEEVNFIKGYVDGRSSCLPIQSDEWELYRKPINEVFSQYEIDFMRRGFEESTLPFTGNFMEWATHESTEKRNRLMTVIFIHDNNDVLELLTAALWFCGKTAVASCQTEYSDREDHFDKSLQACKTYLRHPDAKDEALYLDWVGIGMNQILKEHECKFLIVDFPRPGKQLTVAFETMMKRLRIENTFRGIETLYVSKSASRMDNLAAVEKVLDQLQNRMSPKDRIIFRKSRKIYLDSKLYQCYESDCKEDVQRNKDWGLPEMESTFLWEQLRLHQLKMIVKSSAPNGYGVGGRQQTYQSQRQESASDEDDDDEDLVELDLDEDVIIEEPEDVVDAVTSEENVIEEYSVDDELELSSSISRSRGQFAADQTDVTESRSGISFESYDIDIQGHVYSGLEIVAENNELENEVNESNSLDDNDKEQLFEGGSNVPDLEDIFNVIMPSENDDLCACEVETAEEPYTDSLPKLSRCDGITNLASSEEEFSHEDFGSGTQISNNLFSDNDKRCNFDKHEGSDLYLQKSISDPIVGDNLTSSNIDSESCSDYFEVRNSVTSVEGSQSASNIHFSTDSNISVKFDVNTVESQTQTLVSECSILHACRKSRMNFSEKESEFVLDSDHGLLELLESNKNSQIGTFISESDQELLELLESNKNIHVDTSVSDSDHELLEFLGSNNISQKSSFFSESALSTSLSIDLQDKLVDIKTCNLDRKFSEVSVTSSYGQVDSEDYLLDCTQSTISIKSKNMTQLDLSKSSLKYEKSEFIVKMDNICQFNPKSNLNLEGDNSFSDIKDSISISSKPHSYVKHSGFACPYVMKQILLDEKNALSNGDCMADSELKYPIRLYKSPPPSEISTTSYDSFIHRVQNKPSKSWKLNFSKMFNSRVSPEIVLHSRTENTEMRENYSDAPVVTTRKNAQKSSFHFISRAFTKPFRCGCFRFK